MAKQQKSARYKRIDLLESLVVLGANLLGAALMAFYFSNLHFNLQPRSDYVISPIAITLIITVMLLLLSGMITTRYRKPFTEWYIRATLSPGGVPATPGLQKMVLSLPLVSALTNMLNWLAAALVFGFGGSFHLQTGQLDWIMMGQFFVGMAIAGFAAMVVIYFAVERIWRTELPLFFPDGTISEVDAFRMTVRRRMGLLFIMAILPLLVLAILATLNSRAVVGFALAQDPAVLQALQTRFVRLAVFLGGAGVIVTLALARTLGASLVDALEDLARRMEQVARGNLDERMPVTSNDEIGFLGERFNEMVSNLQRRQIELKTVYQISQDIAASLDLQRTMTKICERVRQIVAYDGAQIFLFDPSVGLLSERARADANGHFLESQGLVLHPGEGCAGQAAQQRRSVIAPEQQSQDGEEISPTQPATCLAAPLLVGQELVGVIELSANQRDIFNDETRQLLDTIAPAAALAIQNAAQAQARERQLQEQIERLQIEIDQVKRARDAQAIQGADYFKNLKDQARRMRRDFKS